MKTKTKRNSNWALDLFYYLFALLVIISGFGLIYLGNQVLMQENLIDAGLWTVGIGILIFFLKNATYLFENPEKDPRTKKFVAPAK